jgi:hypothetical protein
MRTSFIGGLIILAVFLGQSGQARADLVFSISSQDDLSNLAVGETATFEVSLARTAGSPPGYLLASIQYDSSVFDGPTVAAGPIVPSLAGFDSGGTGGGTVTATYDDSIFGTSPITADGIFYSFSLTRIGGMATTLSFGSFAALDDVGAVISISTDPDSISVGAAPAIAVPEPASVALLLSGLALSVSWNRARDGMRRRSAMGAA